VASRLLAVVLIAGLAVLASPTSVLAVSTPTRGAAVAYAEQWALSYNTYYPRLPEDCTNFISQALYSGGRPFIGFDQTYIDHHNWWYDPNSGSFTSTQTWSVTAALLDNFALNDPQFYRVGSWYGIVGGDPGTAGGDLIYYVWPDGTDHAAIQIGWGTDTTTGWQGPLVDAHTTARWHAIWTLQPYNGGWANTTVSAYHIGGGQWGDITIYSSAAGAWVSTENGYSGSDYEMLRARASSWGGWEQYGFEPQSDGTYAIRGLSNNLYVSAELGYAGANYGELRARANAIGAWEKFWLVSLGGNTYALQSAANGLYVSTELGYTGSYLGMLRARASAVGGWEQFTLYSR
jgi:hypothetical protein